MGSGRGGSRLGAGLKPTWKHGKTQTVRVPIALADQLLEIARKLDSSEVSDSDTESNTIDVSAAIALLEEALILKANAGGAIKAKVREALTLLRA
jgi:hypothetical protein